MRQNGQTYFVSSQTAGRKPFFRHERWACLLLNLFEQYRANYLLHAYVVMPDHFHLMLSPVESLEKALQMIKGGFSYRAKRELGWTQEIWQKGFSDHRIRDARDWEQHIDYIQMNPVRARLCERPNDYRYSFLTSDLAMDAIPQRLKPLNFCADNGGTEVPRLQSQI